MQVAIQKLADLTADVQAAKRHTAEVLEEYNAAAVLEAVKLAGLVVAGPASSGTRGALIDADARLRNVEAENNDLEEAQRALEEAKESNPVAALVADVQDMLQKQSTNITQHARS